MTRGVLIVLSGLPGVGKTTLARSAAETLGAIHLRIDTIEAALKRSALSIHRAIDAGYWAAYGVAGDNLRIGHTVIADSVNPIPLTRQAWNELATASDAALLNVELLCSDPIVHRDRIKARKADIIGQDLPDWSAVTRREYDVFHDADLRIDTADHSVESCIAQLISAVKAL